MRGSRFLAITCAASLLATAGASRAEVGVLAISGETLHLAPPHPLIAFDSGRWVSLAPYFEDLARHGAQDDDVVLLLLETGMVSTAEEAFGDLVLYEESGVGRDIGKFLKEPGAALLFETPAGVFDPESATLVRFAGTSGDTQRLSFEPSYVPVPEPGLLIGLAVGGSFLSWLARRARQGEPVDQSRRG